MTNYLNLQLENTTQKWILILVKFNEVILNQKLPFFTESGFLINDEDIAQNKKGYVVLATINHDSKFTGKQESFSPDEILLAKNFFYNQSDGNKKDYHFETSGAIHSFGYGPMYHPDFITKHSFGTFATRKFLFVLFVFDFFII